MGPRCPVPWLRAHLPHAGCPHRALDQLGIPAYNHTDKANKIIQKVSATTCITSPSPVGGTSGTVSSCVKWTPSRCWVGWTRGQRGRGLGGEGRMKRHQRSGEATWAVWGGRVVDSQQDPKSPCSVLPRALLDSSQLPAASTFQACTHHTVLCLYEFNVFFLRPHV